MKLSKANLKLFEKIRKDLESKGATADTLKAEVIGDEVNYTLIAKFPDGTIWEIADIENV